MLGEFHKCPVDWCIYVVWDSSEKTFLLSLKKKKKGGEREDEGEKERQGEEIGGGEGGGEGEREGREKEEGREGRRREEDEEEEKSSSNVICSFIPVRCQALW